MAAYSFTVSQTFALGTHRVVVTSTNLQVYLSSTDELVYNQSYANGIGIRCSSNDFQIGTLTAPQMLTKTVSYSSKKARIWIEEVNNANKVIGADTHDDPSVYNTYNLNQCPVQLSKSGSNAYMKCPCEGSPCTNGCYTYGS